MNREQVEVIIIGAGPAGLSAAIQLKRYGISPRIFEREAIGGLLRNANLVENYPGFPNGIRGLALVRLFREQAHRAGLEITFEEVQKLDYDKDSFTAVTLKNSYQAGLAVISSGTQPKQFTHLKIPAQLSQYVLYEVHSLVGTKGRHILIVGAGDAAFDYALNLASNNDITILNRGQSLKCLPLLWERASQSPRIRYFTGAQVTRISESPAGKLELHCTGIPGHGKISADYLLGALGRTPRLDYVTERLRAQRDDLQNNGLLYMIGDVNSGIYRQTSIAVGQGVLAAMRIYEAIRNKV